jgi:hypothetical protein
MRGVEYVQLMASVPALGPILAAKTAPINRVRLQARLRAMLRPEHVAEIKAAASILVWPRDAVKSTDADFVRHAQKVIATFKSETLRRLVYDRLEQRTVVAALRRRHAKQDAPGARESWGYGRYVGRIRANWRDPHFGLAQTLKWLPAVKDKLDKEDATGLERLLLETAWRQADRMVGAHHFDFEAVALYVVRWDLLDRWTRYDAEAAGARFGALVADALTANPMILQTDTDLMRAVV